MTGIDQLFTVLAVGWLPWVLALAIIGLAWLLWQRFTARLEPLRRALRRATELVEHSEGMAAFKQRFPAIFEGLSQDPVLAGSWRSFAQTLTPVPGNEHALGAPRPPAAVFDDRLFDRVGLNLRFYQSVPNILVGLGLLFTFVGLVAALHFASAGVTASEVSEAQAALRELLAAATFKFVTSIAGLAASLVFSWREKTLLHAARTEIRRFCQVLEERLVPVTPEGLLAAQIEVTRRIDQRLGQLGRSLIVRAPESVEARLADELTLATRPLKTALERVARRFETLDERVAGDLVATTRAVRALTGRANALAEATIGDGGAMPQPRGRAVGATTPDEATPRAAAEAAAPAIPAPDSPAAGISRLPDPAPLPNGVVPAPLRLLQHRLTEVAVAVQQGLDRLRGRPPVDRAGIETVLVTAHDRVREARHALNAVAVELLATTEDPAREAELRAVLGEIDAGLKQSRAALQDAVDGLAPGRRGG